MDGPLWSVAFAITKFLVSAPCNGGSNPSVERSTWHIFAAPDPDSDPWTTGGEVERLGAGSDEGFVSGRFETIWLAMKSALKNSTKRHYIWGQMAPQALDVAYQP
jgi:hypothetical protein